jgi:UDP-N-acetyl-D-glucosamine dehydrogenase
MDSSSDWSRAITARKVRIGIVGLGYTGLPLAEVFIQQGFPVVGFDVDAQRIAALQGGIGYLGHFPTARVQELRSSGQFQASLDFALLAEVDAALICVPTPLTSAREPDLAAVIEASEQIARHLGEGTLVVLTSTTYPGTTREVVEPLLARSGRRFYLAYSPEREDPGNREHSTATIPRVVGGLDPESGQRAQELFAAGMTQVVPVSSTEVAEACKVLENTYRAVNIALVNELKVLYGKMGIDIWEVIAAAQTKPFGFQPFYPGPGWGGHCIPIDPFYLAWVGRKVGAPARFVELAGEINTAMPGYVVDCVTEALNDRALSVRNSRVCLLGMAYKRDVDDYRESPGVQLAMLLHHKGAQVCYHDPHVPRVRIPQLEREWESQPLTRELLQEQDCVVIVTDHSVFDWSWIIEHTPLIVDTRNATRNVSQFRERIVRA